MANFLAPVASEANMSGPLGWIADSWIEGIMEVISNRILWNYLVGAILILSFQWLLPLLGIGEFLPDSLLIDCLASLFCNEGEITQGLCTNILFILCGFDEAQASFMTHIHGCKYFSSPDEQDPAA